MSDDRIYIFDTTLRDGEQVPGCKLNTEQKIIIAKALESLGVDIIEAGFPVSSPGDFNSVEQIAKVITESTVCGLTRAVDNDIEVAGQALKYAKRPRIHTGIGTSDQHVFSKLKTTREEVIRRGIHAVKKARNYTDDVEFYAEDAGRTDNEFLARVCEEMIKAGATVLNIPDTTGYCLPEEYGAKIEYLVNHVPNIDKAILSTHCHNDLGLATANSITGVKHGARQIECTINGIGERAGNTSLEEVVMIIKKRSDIPHNTRVITEKFQEMSHLVSETMGMPVQPNKAIVGSNAFAHSSGIHQDGVIKDRLNYEIIDPAEVGVSRSEIVLTARSGRAALRYRLEQLGYEMEVEEINKVYTEFLIMADSVLEVGDVELHELYENCKQKEIVG